MADSNAISKVVDLSDWRISEAAQAHAKKGAMTTGGFVVREDGSCEYDPYLPQSENPLIPGPVDTDSLSIPYALAWHLGDIVQAAFVNQVAFLSHVAFGGGWFHLPSESPSEDAGVLGKMESWKSLLAISARQQANMREKLITKGLLCELPCLSGNADCQERPRGDETTAVVFVQKRGPQAKLYYRIDNDRYLRLLADLERQFLGA